MSHTQNPQTLPTWSLDHWWTEDVHFPAVSYGPTWNGWATPIVTKETLQKFHDQCARDKDIMDSLRENSEEYGGKILEWEGDSLWLDGSLISPNEDGTYSFGFIGWTFSCSDQFDS